MVSGWLFDTCLISETSRPTPSPEIIAWLQSIPANRVWTSVIVFGELQAGIAGLDESARKRSLVAWHARQRALYGDRCLPIDEPTARAWGDLTAARQRRGRPLPVADGLIAATALVRGLTLATRNGADFTDCGVPVVDPWA